MRPEIVLSSCFIWNCSSGHCRPLMKLHITRTYYGSFWWLVRLKLWSSALLDFLACRSSYLMMLWLLQLWRRYLRRWRMYGQTSICELFLMLGIKRSSVLLWSYKNVTNRFLLNPLILVIIKEHAHHGTYALFRNGIVYKGKLSVSWNILMSAML